MRELEKKVKICPYCKGSQDPKDQPENALKKNTILHGRYLVGNVVGQGGFGITYVGYDLVLEMKVAVKEYFPTGPARRSHTYPNQIQWSYGDDDKKLWAEGIERFLKEARKMARLDSVSAIVRVRDAFRENQTAYIVMDFVEGVTLKKYLADEGKPMQWQECRRLMVPLMESLAVIHGQGFIHRDISPDNIMVQPDGTVRLLDLGAAVDIQANGGQASMAVVRKNFSAPEQYLETESLGSWTDVYAMGATIYYCLTGKLVPEAMERDMKGTRLMFDPAQNIPSSVQKTLNNAVQLRPKDRIQDMKEFCRQLSDGQTVHKDQDTDNNSRKTDNKGDNGKDRDTKNGGSREGTGFSAWKKKKVLVSVPGGVLLGAAILFVLLWSAFSDGQQADVQPSERAVYSGTKQVSRGTGSVFGSSADLTDQAPESSLEETGKSEAEPQKDDEDWGEDGKFMYSLNDDGTYTLEISILDADTAFMEIPGKFNGKKVTKIGDYAFIGRENLEQVNFPDTIQILGEEIFSGCSHLKAVMLPSSIEEIQSPFREEAYDTYLAIFCSATQKEIKSLDWCEGWYGAGKSTTYSGAWFADDPSRNKGWQKFNEEWLFLENGRVLFGWQTINGKQYYFDEDGSAHKGWMKDGSKEFYFDETDCFMTTGWREVEGQWHYFGQESGEMLKNTTTPDGYQVDQNGVYNAGAMNSSDYIFPDSDTRLLTNKEVQDLTQEELRIAINEIYARHGRKFDSQELQDYFNSKSWYRGTVDPEEFQEDMLSAIEKKNLELLEKYRSFQGVKLSENNHFQTS